MTDKQTLQKKTEVVELSNELTYRRYLMNKGKIRELFQKVSIPEYIALHMIASENDNPMLYSGRTYLKDLSEKMQLTMRQTSKMVGELKDRGLLCWSHDGNGSEGTYVTITETGEKILCEQEEILRDYYGKVIDIYGKENMIDLLQMMKQLETVMSREIEEMEASVENGGTDG